MDATRLTRDAGSLTVTVWYDGVDRTPSFGNRHRWAYQLESSDATNWEPVQGADLYLSPVAPNDPREAMRTLLSFLSASGESYAHAMRNPGSKPENLNLFPGWVAEAAYLNSDELDMLALELEETDGDEPDPAYRDALASGEVDPVARRDVFDRLEQIREPDQDPEREFAKEHEVDDDEPRWPPARWFDVVFLQGDEGYNMVDLIDEQGADTTIAHLANWDFGDETRNTALFHGLAYDDPPSSIGDRTAESGPYRLQWHSGLGHVNLLRRFEPTDSRPAWWPDRPARLSPVTPPDIDNPEPPVRRDSSRKPGGPAL